jgi:hypothetical protein
MLRNGGWHEQWLFFFRAGMAPDSRREAESSDIWVCGVLQGDDVNVCNVKDALTGG